MYDFCPHERIGAVVMSSELEVFCRSLGMDTLYSDDVGDDGMSYCAQC